MLRIYAQGNFRDALIHDSSIKNFRGFNGAKKTDDCSRSQLPGSNEGHVSYFTEKKVDFLLDLIHKIHKMFIKLIY